MKQNPQTMRPRLASLLTVIQRRGGEWTRSTAAAVHGRAAPKSTTASRDLNNLYRRGYLDVHDGPRGRYYTLRRTR